MDRIKSLNDSNVAEVLQKEGGSNMDYTSLENLSDRQKNQLFDIARKCFELIGPEDDDDETRS